MRGLVLLLTSPRVAPGLLTWRAWQLLQEADLVCCASGGSALPTVVGAEGVDIVEREPSLAGLLEAAETQGVVWLAEPDGDAELFAEMAAEAAQRAGAGIDAADGCPLEVMTGSYDLEGASLLDLVAVMDRLRSACPWDREQTHESLVHYLVEETYETVEAIERGDRDELREELGDLLLQIAFHARIAQEHPDTPWSIDDVATGIVDKLVRRHPHVFADVEVSGAGEVEANWHTLKAAEKGRKSALDGVPLAMPALTLADKLLSRSGKAGYRATAGTSLETTGIGEITDADQLGDLLLQVVVAARAAGLDAEQSLRAALRRFAGSIRAEEHR